MNRLIGIVLVVLGIVGLAWGGFSYTRKEKAVDLGPLEITTSKRETVPIPPIAGGLALAGGILMLVMNKKG